MKRRHQPIESSWTGAIHAIFTAVYGPDPRLLLAHIVPNPRSNGFRKSSGTLDHYLHAGPQGDPDYRWQVANFMELDVVKTVIIVVIFIK